MKTYPTPEEAIINGTGNCLYEKNNRFIAVDIRATSSIFNLLVDGFKLVIKNK